MGIGNLLGFGDPAPGPGPPVPNNPHAAFETQAIRDRWGGAGDRPLLGTYCMPDTATWPFWNPPATQWQGQGRKQAPRGAATLGPPPPWQPPSFLSCRDRKKKRFVGQTGQEDKKKIKTESGRYISSSYKRDLYPEGWG